MALSRRLNSGVMRIVVVDDDREVRESLRRSLEFNGYTVELAQDGQQAMDAVARRRPEAMVLDMTRSRAGRCGRCLRRWPGYDQGEGQRRWRGLDLGTTRAFVQASAPRGGL